MRRRCHSRRSNFPENAVEFDALGAHLASVKLTSHTCQKVEGHSSPNPMEVRSPDGKWAVFRRGDDLCIRSLATGEERALTSDGVPDHSYGSPPDCLTFGALMRKFGAPHLPPLVSWSPDSRHVVTHRLDQRNIRLSHLIESSPAGGAPPVLHSYRYAFPGDEIVPTAELVVFDPVTGNSVTAKTAPILLLVTSPFMSGFFWWSGDGSAAYFIEQPRDLKTVWLKCLDPATGEVRTLIEERGSPYLDVKQFLNAKAQRLRPLAAARKRFGILNAMAGVTFTSTTQRTARCGARSPLVIGPCSRSCTSMRSNASAPDVPRVGTSEIGPLSSSGLPRRPGRQGFCAIGGRRS